MIGLKRGTVRLCEYEKDSKNVTYGNKQENCSNTFRK